MSNYYLPYKATVLVSLACPDTSTLATIDTGFLGDFTLAPFDFSNDTIERTQDNMAIIAFGFTGFHIPIPPVR